MLKEILMKINDWFFIISWGSRKEELIYDKETYDWFYCSDNYDVRSWYTKG